jgi:hypothetical protein
MSNGDNDPNEKEENPATGTPPVEIPPDGPPEDDEEEENGDAAAKRRIPR